MVAKRDRAVAVSASCRPQRIRAAGHARQEVNAEKADALAKRVARRSAIVLRESMSPIDWVHEPETGGVRSLVRGALWSPVPTSDTASIIGGLGSILDRVDVTSPAALDAMTAIFESQAIIRTQGGPTIRHMHHMVLAKPHGTLGAVQTWQPDTGMRAVRHLLANIGLSPNRHDAIVFRHAKNSARPDGTRKIEEALHVVFCRTRDDGAYFQNWHLVVSAAIAQVRYDYHAGLDPMRMPVPSCKAWSLCAGFNHVDAGTLCAQYVDGTTARLIETVPLQGPTHMARLAAEGYPEPLDCAGVWTSVPVSQAMGPFLAYLAKG
jgi:hypothetical protein